MKRYEVETRTNPYSNDKPYVAVSENHTNPDGKIVNFPAFSLSVEDAQELLMDLAVAVTEAKGFVQFTRATR